ncbi:MAG: aspartate kinase [Chloroflexota bacterium]
MSEKSSKTLVMKYGGTSVGVGMPNAVQIVKDTRAEWGRVVVVTSAISGATDRLLNSATHAAQGDLTILRSASAWLRQSHADLADKLVADPARRAQVNTEIGALIDSFVELCRAIGVLGEASPRALDAVASLGERMSVRLLSAAIESAGVPSKYVEATELILTNDRFQHAHPDFAQTTERTRRVLNPLLDQGLVPVVTGFIGATEKGAITTLGRGGSDYSAAILGAALPADDVWIWTDVDGVMTADPRLVPDARTLGEVTYSEVAELAYYGAKVLHPKTIRPVVDAGIGLRICNTFNPSHPGTRLVANNGNGHRAAHSGDVVRAVTAIRQQRLVTIEGRGMLGVPGVAARTFGAVASTGTSVPLITQASSEQSICFAVPFDMAGSIVGALENVFAEELEDGDIDRVWMTDEVAILTVVGAGMRHTPGVSGHVFNQLGVHSVNVLAIAQGSSEVSISIVIDSADTERAVKALHEMIVK